MTQTAHPGTNDQDPATPADLTDDALPPKFAQATKAKRRALAHEANSTRERILDVALDLFVAQGYDGTSLRQIAEQLGVTKAALYYHFESKEDILRALHMRLHEFGKNALDSVGDEPMTLELWGQLLDQVVDQMLAQRKLFLMHERNQASSRSCTARSTTPSTTTSRTSSARSSSTPGWPSGTGSAWRPPSVPPSPGSSSPARASPTPTPPSWATCSANASGTSSRDDGIQPFWATSPTAAPSGWQRPCRADLAF